MNIAYNVLIGKNWNTGSGVTLTIPRIWHYAIIAQESPFVLGKFYEEFRGMGIYIAVYSQMVSPVWQNVNEWWNLSKGYHSCIFLVIFKFKIISK